MDNNIDSTDVRLMAAINNTEREQCYASNIADAAGIDAAKSTIHRHLNKLLNSGFLAIDGDAMVSRGSMRSPIYRLTDRGREQLDRIVVCDCGHMALAYEHRHDFKPATDVFTSGD